MYTRYYFTLYIYILGFCGRFDNSVTPEKRTISPSVVVIITIRRSYNSKLGRISVVRPLRITTNGKFRVTRAFCYEQSSSVYKRFLRNDFVVYAAPLSATYKCVYRHVCLLFPRVRRIICLIIALRSFFRAILNRRRRRTGPRRNEKKTTHYASNDITRKKAFRFI